MREIKFRAWNKRRRFMDSAWMIDFEHGEVCHSKHNVSDIDDCVLMQFTGLKDINGKEIYEGDIIGSPRGSRHIVSFDSKNAGYVAEMLPYRDSSRIFQSWIDDFRKIVIGNIYENPEQLESKP